MFGNVRQKAIAVVMKMAVVTNSDLEYNINIAKNDFDTL